MKSTYLNTLILSLALILNSCAGEGSYNKDINTEVTESENDDLEIILPELEKQNSALSKEQLKAFEERAIQKFYDFTDYVKIISDPKVSIDLKDHTKLLATELFKTDSFNLDSSNLPHFNSISIRLYLELAKLSIKPIYITPVGVVVTEKLELDSIKGNYTGLIETSIIVNGKKENYKIDIYLIELNKSFGNNTERIREVRLGNIY
ncbi:MAG: hypothetical protein COA97_01935 [Flavobacteriales bacterium]|nr:MAG: hypothetical protein COA97_01935 [Flavobacteriales bacterium]